MRLEWIKNLYFSTLKPAIYGQNKAMKSIKYRKPGKMNEWNILPLEACLHEHQRLTSWQRLCEDTYRATYLPAFPEADIEAYIARHFQEEALLQWARSDKHKGWLACHEGEVVGYVLLHLGVAPGGQDDRQQACLDKFYVSVAYQGRGVAQMLWQRAVSFALQEEYKQLWLITWRDNKRAIRFYEKIGFRIAGSYPFRLGERTYCDHLMVFEVEEARQNKHRLSG